MGQAYFQPPLWHFLVFKSVSVDFPTYQSSQRANFKRKKQIKAVNKHVIMLQPSSWDATQSGNKMKEFTKKGNDTW